MNGESANKSVESYKMDRASASHFEPHAERSVKDMKRIHWIIITGVAAMIVAHVLLRVTEPPEPPKGPSQEELRKQMNEHSREMKSSLETYLGCSVPGERSTRISQRHLPSPSVWLYISADASELAVMRDEIDASGWTHGPPSVGIPVPVDATWEWTPPSSNVWSRHETTGNAIRVWVAAEDEGKMYYCQFIESTETKKPNKTGGR